MEQKSSLDQTSSESFFFFNPRTPCGVRQTGGEITYFLVGPESEEPVSIHALLAECDYSDGVRQLRCDRDHGKGVNLG